MKAFANLFIAHYKQFIRDKAALFFTFIFPIMFILIFGWAFSDPDARHFDIGFVNQDTSDVSEDSPSESVYDGLYNVIINADEVDEEPDRMFDIEEGELDAELSSLRDGDLDAVVVIPDGFGESLATGQETNIEVHYDPSQTSTAQILIPVLQQVIDGVERDISSTAKLVSLDPYGVSSHQLRTVDYLLPGILGMSLMFTGIYGAMPIIQQRQAHIIKRLGCTPLRRSSMVFSELAFRMILVLLTAALIVAVGRLAFDVQMVGNWGALFGISILGTMVFVCIGYIIAAFVRTVEGAEPIINVITFPMMFLSGTFFPVENFPDFIAPVVKALPLTYVSDALRQIMVDGSPLYPMTTDIFVMAGWTVVCLLITIRFFRWD